MLPVEILFDMMNTKRRRNKEFMTCTLHEILLGLSNGACGKRCIHHTGRINLKERDHSEDLDIDWKNTRMDPRKIGREGVDWIQLAQGRDK
jgi:hypothetical protein